MSGERFTVRWEGPRIRLELGGRPVAQFGAAMARELAGMLRNAAGHAEEFEQAERMIQDSAILMRTGAPVALTSNPRIIDAAKNEAAFNRDLRRYIRGRRARGLDAKPVVHGPTITQGDPP